jgi:hypothetical protein
MTILTLSSSPAPETRGLARIVAAVTATLGTVVDVFVEAGDQCAAARDRFPLAD